MVCWLQTNPGSPGFVEAGTMLLYLKNECVQDMLASDFSIFIRSLFDDQNWRAAELLGKTS
jgi:hypothetical protein